MEARILGRAYAAAALVLLAAGTVCAAPYRTANFVIYNNDPQFAKQVGDEAERFRRELAIDWLGSELPNWSEPCPITVNDGPNLGAGGATSFMFDRGQVFGWKMNIQGSRERVLDSVLPHEVTHTVFATHFRQPLPRWADEGACTTVEHRSERLKHRNMLIHFLKTGRGIAFSKMYVMKEYPRDVMPLYAQGHALASFLVSHGGKQKFVKYIEEGLRTNRWTDTTRRFYSFESLASLQNNWLDWVRQGMPPIEQPAGTLLASAEGAGAREDLGDTDHRSVAEGATGEGRRAGEEYGITRVSSTEEVGETSPATFSKSPRPEPNLIYRVAGESDVSRSAGDLVPVPDRRGLTSESPQPQNLQRAGRSLPSPWFPGGTSELSDSSARVEHTGDALLEWKRENRS